MMAKTRLQRKELTKKKKKYLELGMLANTYLLPNLGRMERRSVMPGYTARSRPC